MSQMLVLLSLFTMASGASLGSADDSGGRHHVRREVRASLMTEGEIGEAANADRRTVAVDATGELHDVDDAVSMEERSLFELHEQISNNLSSMSLFELHEQIAKNFSSTHSGASLPKSCMEFFKDDCRMHDILPDPKNATEIKEAFVACCVAPDHGGHKKATCDSLADETFTLSEATEEECNALIDLYKAHQEVAKSNAQAKLLEQRAKQHNQTDPTVLAESLDASLTGKAPPAAGAKPPSSKNGRFTIGTTPVKVQGNNGVNPIVIFYHGWGGACWNCGGLQDKLSSAGYAVVAPCDHTSATDALFFSGDWGNRVFRDVMAWQGHRRIGLVGYSAGGGAVIKVSYDNAQRNPRIPIVSLHGAPMLAGAGFSQGPILFLTGDGENNDNAGSRVGQTTPYTSWDKFYWQTYGKKVYMKWGNQATHSWPCLHGSQEWDAIVQWLNCYLQGSNSQCENHQHGICRTGGVVQCLP